MCVHQRKQWDPKYQVHLESFPSYNIKSKKQTVKPDEGYTAEDSRTGTSKLLLIYFNLKM